MPHHLYPGSPAHFGLAVDKTHRINVWFRGVICHYLWQDSLIGKERMSQPVGGNKVKVLNLEDVIVEAVVELAMSGEFAVPVDNIYNGADVFRDEDGFVHGLLRNGVRFVTDDEAIVIYKFESYGLAAQARFTGEMVSSSVLVAIAKEWL
jgi:hypothetical protein